MSDGFDELHKLAADIGEVAKRTVPLIGLAVKGAALTGKKAWQADARRHRMTPGYPPSIDFDPVSIKGGAVTTDLGPNLSRGVGTPGFGILEDSPGGVSGAPRRSDVAAEKAIEPDLERGVLKAIDQGMKGGNL